MCYTNYMETHVFSNTMKTQQIMLRPLGNLNIRQNHKTRMVCLNDFTPGNRYMIDNWKSLQSTEAFIDTVCQKEGLTRTEVISSVRGREGGTWTHPLVAVDFAMWISPEFKYEALKWLYDGLCELRDIAGDSFKGMAEAIDKVLSPSRSDAGNVYAQETWMIQEIAGIRTGQRNMASVEQLDDLCFLEKANTKLLQAGMKERSKRRDELRRLLEFRKL